MKILEFTKILGKETGVADKFDLSKVDVHTIAAVEECAVPLLADFSLPARFREFRAAVGREMVGRQRLDAGLAGKPEAGRRHAKRWHPCLV